MHFKTEKAYVRGIAGGAFRGRLQKFKQQINFARRLSPNSLQIFRLNRTEANDENLFCLPQNYMLYILTSVWVLGTIQHFSKYIVLMFFVLNSKKMQNLTKKLIFLICTELLV